MENSSATEISFRPATLDDIALLLHWQSQPHVIAAGAGGDWNWDQELAEVAEWRVQLIAELDARPLGFLQILDPSRDTDRYWGKVMGNPRGLDIFIGEARDLGRGYGGEMMRQALARCFAEPGVSGVLIDPLASNRAAIRFYQRLGFEFVETRRFDADLCDVHFLSRETWTSLRN